MTSTSPSPSPTPNPTNTTTPQRALAPLLRDLADLPSDLLTGVRPSAHVSLVWTTHPAQVMADLLTEHPDAAVVIESPVADHPEYATADVVFDVEGVKVHARFDPYKVLADLGSLVGDVNAAVDAPAADVAA